MESLFFYGRFVRFHSYKKPNSVQFTSFQKYFFDHGLYMTESNYINKSTISKLSHSNIVYLKNKYKGHMKIEAITLNKQALRVYYVVIF